MGAPRVGTVNGRCDGCPTSRLTARRSPTSARGMIRGVVVLNQSMTLRLAILGDSIAYGVGAAQPADAIGPRLVRDLAAAGLPAQSRTFAVPGARSSDLAGQARAARPWRPDVAVILVGANDLTHLIPPDR